MSEHGKRDECEFRGAALGKAKTRATMIGREQRDAFQDMLRMLEALAGDGITVNPEQITFEDDVDQAAWKRFIMPSNLRGAGEAPMMNTEGEILRAVQ